MSVAGAGLRCMPPAARVGAIAGAAVLVLIPAIATAVAIVHPQWYPTGDMAQAELHVRGFWSHPPLVGAAGRIQSSSGVQGSHPGPLLWLAMWPVYALFGSTSTALVISVVTVHVATAAIALWLAVRRGGAELAVALAVVLALIVRAGGPDQFTEPWNPWMGLLPFLVLLLACWSFLDGDGWAIVLAVAAGTYCVHAHTGYVPVAGGLLALAVVVVVVRAARQRAGREGSSALVRSLWWIGGAALAGLVLWIPPIIDQLRREPGNLSILLDSFAHPDAPYLGAGDVAEITVVQFNVLGPWVLGAGRDDVTVPAVVGFLAFVALWSVAVASAWRRRAVGEIHLHAVLAVAGVLAVFSVSRIFGLFLEYTVRWLWVLVGTIVAASLVSLWRSRPPRNQRAVTVAAGIAVAVIVAVAVVVGTAQHVGRAGPTGAIDSRIVGGLVARIEPELDDGTPYLVRWWDPTVLGATGFGLVLELERRGHVAGVDLPFAAGALPHRVLPEDRAGAVLYVVVGTPAIERARSLPGVVELGWFDVRTPEQRRRSDDLRGRLEEALRSSGRSDQIPVLDAPYGQAVLLFADPPLPAEIGTLLDEYVALRQPTAVFRAAPGTPVLPLG